MQKIYVKAITDFDIRILRGEILPSEVQGWLTRTGRITQLLTDKKAELGYLK